MWATVEHKLWAAIDTTKWMNSLPFLLKTTVWEAWILSGVPIPWLAHLHVRLDHGPGSALPCAVSLQDFYPLPLPFNPNPLGSGFYLVLCKRQWQEQVKGLCFVSKKKKQSRWKSFSRCRTIISNDQGEMSYLSFTGVAGFHRSVC